VLGDSSCKKVAADTIGFATRAEIPKEMRLINDLRLNLRSIVLDKDTKLNKQGYKPKGLEIK
jgi:hypothetical protein